MGYFYSTFQSKMNTVILMKLRELAASNNTLNMNIGPPPPSPPQFDQSLFLLVFPYWAYNNLRFRQQMG